jgi:hypothetical protein
MTFHGLQTDKSLGNVATGPTVDNRALRTWLDLQLAQPNLDCHTTNVGRHFKKGLHRPTKGGSSPTPTPSRRLAGCASCPTARRGFRMSRRVQR